MIKTLEQIQKKIDSDKAEIFTATEIKEKLDDNEKLTVDDVDVVTCGTCGIMSGTSVVMHMNVTEPGVFKKAKSVLLNGIEAYPGPCPNELLGSLDVVLYGTNHSKTIKNYGGGHLLEDILKGKSIDVEFVDVDDNKFNVDITVDDIVYARMLGIRQAFKNYSAFTNPQKNRAKSIFHATVMKGPFTDLSFSGCGDINPLQNDPNQDVIKSSSKVYLNGAEGLVVDNGTRSSIDKPNLFLTADFKKMNDYYLGGIKTGFGTEVYNSVAIGIPVLNESILENLKVRNKDISLTLNDIHGRHLPLCDIDYSLWDGSDLRPTVDTDLCHHCLNCLPFLNCPTNAFDRKEKTINPYTCFGCGICQSSCSFGTIQMKLNEVCVTIDDTKHTIPVTCRQSDKKRAIEITNELKDKILNGSFKL